MNRAYWESFALSKFLIGEVYADNHKDAEGPSVSCQEVLIGQQKAQFLKLANESNVFGG